MVGYSKLVLIIIADGNWAFGSCFFWLLNKIVFFSIGLQKFSGDCLGGKKNPFTSLFPLNLMSQHIHLLLSGFDREEIFLKAVFTIE